VSKVHLRGDEGGELVSTTFARADEYREAMWALPLTNRPPVVVYGKECRQNRSVGFFSDESAGYTYSGQRMKAEPLTAELAEIMDHVNDEFGEVYNGILVNVYHDGRDYIGAHCDDENHLGVSGVVSITFGETRTFRVRDRKTKKIAVDVDACDGTVLHMRGPFQKEFTHEVPKQLRIKSARLSLTFRHHSM
jgi:alkylated DNA repair dioxygenase AlkB